MKLYAQLKDNPAKWELLPQHQSPALNIHTGNTFYVSYFDNERVTVNASHIKPSELVAGFKEAGLL